MNLDNAADGDAIADVYDDWFTDRPSTAAAVDFLARQAGWGAEPFTAASRWHVSAYKLET